MVEIPYEGPRFYPPSPQYLKQQLKAAEKLSDHYKFEADRLKVFVDRMKPQLTGKDQREATKLLACKPPEV